MHYQIGGRGPNCPTLNPDWETRTYLPNRRQVLSYTSITWCITCITCSIISCSIPFKLHVQVHDKYMLDYLPLHPAPFHYMFNYMIYFMPLHPSPAPLHNMLYHDYMINYKTPLHIITSSIIVLHVPLHVPLHDNYMTHYISL